jgi:molecular chaperone DnaK
MLREHRDSLAADDVNAVEAALNDGKEALKNDDVAAMEQARERITQASHKLAEAMYKRTAESGDNGEQQGAKTTGTKSKDGEVVDAEFEDVN